METILIATCRKTGNDIVLLGREAGYPAQAAKYKEFTSQVNEEYSHVELLSVHPNKKPLKFVTQAELDERNKRRAAAEAEAKKAQESSEKTESTETATKKKKKAKAE